MEEQKALVSIDASGQLIKPTEIVSDATEKAKLLKQIVKKAGLAQKFGRNPKEYLQFEAWQTIGKFYGATPMVIWTKRIEKDGTFIGWEARAEVIDANGRRIGAAEAMCTNTERNWRGRDEYAIRSMAQTRACAKALRSVFSWVAVLAGYAPTPAEEVTDEIIDAEVIDNRQVRPSESPKAKKNEKSITDAQRRKLFKLMTDAGLNKDEARDLFHYVEPETKEEASKFIDKFDDYLKLWKQNKDKDEDF